MSAVAVRPAGPGDLTRVVELAKRRFAAGWSFASLKAEIGRPDSIFLVAPERGYALARVVDRDCRLLDIAVSSDGTGCGRALLSALTSVAAARGCAKVSLEASAVNARALDFYAKAGAFVVGRRPKFYTDGTDAVLMDIALV